VGIVSRLVVAGCAILIATSSTGAQQTPLADAITAANDVYSGPFGYQEDEQVVVASPSQAIAFELPAGSTVRDYEASPTGGEVAVLIEDADHRQHLAF
jgi:hypothetical protein